jgi:hypothetical protein
MTEDQLRWIIPAALVVVVVLYLLLHKRADQARAREFEALAAHVRAKVTVASEFASSFPVDVAGRKFTVSYALRGGGVGASPSGSWYLVTGTPLRGHAWDLHSVTIRQKLWGGNKPFDEAISVQEFGLPLRSGWLTQSVRDTILAIYTLPNLKGELLIEEGELRHRLLGSISRVEPAALKSLIAKLGELATALERARG